MIHQNISIIVAIAKNYAIGSNNNLLFYLPDDLKRFKKITTGHPIIMGKNTLLSLPNGPLPNRRNIVVSKSLESFEGVEIVRSIEEAVEKVKNEEEAFVIGGGMIYEQFYPVAGKLYLTLVHEKFEADTFFPEIDYTEWEELEREEHHDKKNDFDYTYLTLRR
ncbi:dihydrofolate reductase [Prolixibacter sp. NT017]|uniref:dihydrofolate reductase n=1 Tax=Prolixibacter sp. NT017 TaxID=2652390 RepID=UPI00126D6E79|nr:dihydrofolate reductase [Prolixibacter sp. NT017]GET26880.1 dihydrofolate reductase [Prolixibacter sp. NT017]